MFRKLILSVLIVFAVLPAKAQTDSSHLRISLITCGTGPEVWETFGHTAIRVTDSVHGTDLAFNYGTFAFDDDFALKFMRGKLLYYLSFYPYSDFLQEYVEASRSVHEQVLYLDGSKKQEIYEFLKNNAQEENRYYKYDFFFDNCATRIRDVFPRSLGKDFVFGKTAAAANRLTFRDIINRYYYYKHWERFGINILLGSRIDKVMSNEDIMFLPDFLSDGIGGAIYAGRKIAGNTQLIIGGSQQPPRGINWPFVVFSVAALITIIGLLVKGLRPVGSVMQFLFLIVSGLLGILMLVMWLGTDHQGCQNNFNILWALPTNAALAVLPKKNKGRYALVAIFLMGVALVLHILKIQELPLLELSPILLALLFIYGTIYKRSKM